MPLILITGRTAQGEMRDLRCLMYAARQHTVQNKERANWFFHSLKTINCPAKVSTKLTGHKVPRVKHLSLMEANVSVMTTIPVAKT